MGQRDPVYTPRDYKRLAEQGYEWNTWVYACVNEVSRTCKGIPWVVYQGQGESGARMVRALREGRSDVGARRAIKQAVDRKDLREVHDHPLLKLLARPNPEQGGGAFWEAYFGYWQLAGNSYIEAVRLQNRPPIELWPLRPDRMKVLPNPQNRIGGYVYTAGGGQVRFAPGEVLHSKFWHPTNDWYGMSPIEAAARSIDGDNAAQAWNTAMVQNGARPSGALSTEGELTSEQKIDLKDQLDNRSRPEAAGRALLLEGGLSWVEMGLTPRDMDWLNQQKWGLKRIAAAFGVPMPLIDPESSATYANYKTARIALYQDTVLPLMDHARDDLNGWLVPMFDESLLLAYDPDSIEALQQDRADAWERTDDVRLTIDERRTAVGLDPLPNGLGEVIVLGTGESIVPVEDLLAPPATGGDQTADDAPAKPASGGKQTKSQPWWTLSAESWLEQTAARRAGIVTDSTRMRVAALIAARAAAGDTPAQIADVVQRSYADMGEIRADLIGRSEVIAAANAGGRFAALSTGLDLEREWIADPDGRHSAEDGQRRSMFDPYDVDGHSAMFPGDPDLPADQGVNCRCTEQFHRSDRSTPVERRSEVYGNHERYREAWEQTVKSSARRLFAAEGDTVAATIRKATDSAGAMRVAEALPTAPWRELYQTAYRAVMEDFGQRVIEELR